MMQFLMIGMMIIFVSMLSGGSGLIGTLAAAILPFLSVIGVGLMTLHFWMWTLNGQNQNLLPGNGAAPAIPLDPGFAFADFMNGLLHYGGRFLYGLVGVAGRMIAWGLPGGARVRGERAAVIGEPDGVPEGANFAPPPRPRRAPAAQPAPIPAGAPVPVPPVAAPAAVIDLHIHIHTDSNSDLKSDSKSHFNFEQSFRPSRSTR